MLTILDSSLTFKSEINEQQADRLLSLGITVTEKNISFQKYIQIRSDIFEETLENVYRIVRFTGEVLVVKIINDIFTEGRYKIVKGSPVFEACQLKTIPKKGKSGEKRVALTDDEKMDLLREFIETNDRLPTPKETFKEFNVGTYYHTIVKWNNLYENLQKDITKYQT